MISLRIPTSIKNNNHENNNNNNNNNNNRQFFSKMIDNMKEIQGVS
jgi:hypothetical protein